MSRLKLLLPNQFKFSAKIPVRITDVNYGGHVGNDALLGIIHEARMQFLLQFGYSEMNFEDVSLIMGDVAIEFKSEVFYGDTLNVSVTAAEFSYAGFDIFYKLEKEADGKIIIVANAKTGMICYNYKLKKVVAIPAEAVEKLQN